MDARPTHLHPIPQPRSPRSNIPSIHNLLPSTLPFHQQDSQSGRCGIDLLRQAKGRYNSTTRRPRIENSQRYGSNITRRPLRRPHHQNLRKVRSRPSNSRRCRRRFHTPLNRRYPPPPTYLLLPPTPHKNPHNPLNKMPRKKRLVPERTRQPTSLYNSLLNRARNRDCRRCTDKFVFCINHRAARKINHITIQHPPHEIFLRPIIQLAF